MEMQAWNGYPSLYISVGHKVVYSLIMDSNGLPPARKIAATGYQFCPHCQQAVSKRTYMRHMSLIPGSSSTLSANATVSYTLAVDMIIAVHFLYLCC